MYFWMLLIAILVIRYYFNHSWGKAILYGFGVHFLISLAWNLVLSSLGFFFESPILTIFIVVGIVLVFRYLSNNHPSRTWLKAGYDQELDTQKALVDYGKMIKSGQTYPYAEIPIGRATAFMSDFEEVDANAVTLLGFNPIPSSEDSDFTEYGTLTTDQGILLKYQTQVKTKVPDTGKKLTVNETNPMMIPFDGLYEVDYDQEKNRVGFLYADFSRVEVDLEHYLLSADEIKQIQYLIDRGVTLNLTFENQAVEMTVEELDEADEAVREAYQSLIMRNYVGVGSVEAALAGATFPSGVASGFNDVSSHLNANQFIKMVQSRQGHGEAAEYSNNVFDRLKGFNVESTGGGSSPNEARGQGSNAIDRTRTNFFTGETQFIQTKTYQDDNLNNMVREYVKTDYPKGTVLEVGRGQKDKVEDLLAQHGAEDVKVIEGVSVKWAQGVTKAGTIPSLTVDLVDGAIQSSGTAGVTFIISYTQARHLGLTPKESVKLASSTGLKTLASGTFMRAFSSQFAKSQVGQDLAEVLGINIDELAGRISVGVTAIIVYGPTVTDYLRGYVSETQLAKNVTVSTVGVLGGVAGKKVGEVVGSAWGPVGSVVGGMAAAYASQKVMDHFFEDDSKENFRLYKEEFIDYIYQLSLNEEEFKVFFEKTLNSKNFPKQLKQIYKAGKGIEGAESEKAQRDFIVSELLEPKLVEILQDRPVISQAEIETAYEESQVLLEELAVI